MLVHAAVTINVIFRSRQTQDDPSGFNAFLCYLQAFLFQTARTAFIWHWILSMIVIYLVIVRKVSVNTLRSHSHWYYTILGLVTILSTAIPMIANRLGRVPNFPICWINGVVEWRLVFVFLHDVIVMLVFSVFTFPIARELHRGSKCNVRNSFVLKDLMYQHLIQAVYLFFLFLISGLASLNRMLLELSDAAWNSSYIASTDYTFCVTSLYLFYFFGIVTVLIHTITYLSIKDFITKIKTKLKRSEMISAPNSTARYTESINTYSKLETPKTTTNPPISAVSIPPDSEQRRILLRAHKSYTLNVLQNVREELADLGMEASEIDSFITEQSGLSTTENESEQDFSERLLAAQQRWRLQTNNV